MAKASKTETERPAPRLYLITPGIDDSAAFARTLSDVLGTTNVAAVLLRLNGPTADRHATAADPLASDELWKLDLASIR